MLTFVYFIFSAKKIFQHCNIGVTEIVQEEPRAVCWAATELPTFPETALFVTIIVCRKRSLPLPFYVYVKA